MIKLKFPIKIRNEECKCPLAMVREVWSVLYSCSAGCLRFGFGRKVETQLGRKKGSQIHFQNTITDKFELVLRLQICISKQIQILYFKTQICMWNSEYKYRTQICILKKKV